MLTYVSVVKTKESVSDAELAVYKIQPIETLFCKAADVVVPLKEWVLKISTIMPDGDNTAKFW